MVSSKYVVLAAVFAAGCGGADGAVSLVSVTDEPAGENCPDGGLAIQHGVDADDDGTLDGDEVTATSYVCNGSKGAESLVTTTPEAAGEECANGGQRLDHGLDDDGDGVLAADEIDGSIYVCAGEDAVQNLISISDEPVGDACAAGGRRIDSGLDHDDDGVLAADEIDETSYLCSEHVCTIRFDDAWLALGQGANPDTYYTTYGVSFDNGIGYGLIGGEGNGDPGNWNIEGTDGSAAWGLWEGQHGISFATRVSEVELDFLRGGNDYTIDVEAFDGATSRGTQTVSPTGALGVATMEFAGTIDSLVWTQPCCYGVDRIRYRTTAACP